MIFSDKMIVNTLNRVCTVVGCACDKQTTVSQMAVVLLKY